MWKSDWYNYYYHSNTQIGKQWKNEWEWRNKSPGFILQVAKATRHFYLLSPAFIIKWNGTQNITRTNKKIMIQQYFFDETNKT